MFRTMIPTSLFLAALAAPFGPAAFADVSARTYHTVQTPHAEFLPSWAPNDRIIMCGRAGCPSDVRGSSAVEHKLWALQEELGLIHSMLSALAHQVDELRQDKRRSAVPLVGTSPAPEGAEDTVRCSFDLEGEEGAQALLATLSAGPSGWTGQYAMSVVLDAPAPVTINSGDTLTLDPEETRELTRVDLSDARRINASLTLQSGAEVVVCQRSETLDNSGVPQAAGHTAKG